MSRTSRSFNLNCRCYWRHISDTLYYYRCMYAFHLVVQVEHRRVSAFQCTPHSFGINACISLHSIGRIHIHGRSAPLFVSCRSCWSIEFKPFWYPKFLRNELRSSGARVDDSILLGHICIIPHPPLHSKQDPPQKLSLNVLFLFFVTNTKRYLRTPSLVLFIAATETRSYTCRSPLDLNIILILINRWLRKVLRCRKEKSP